MSEDTVAVAAVQPANTPKKKTKGAPKKTKSAPTHPKVSEMVLEAIKELKERGGSSLQAIKKHVSANNKVDMDRLTPFIKKFLKSAVASGALVQTKGKGATGSFKLGTSEKKESKPKATKPKKETAAKKKSATPKKAPKPKAKAAEKKKKTAPAKKTPVKKAAKPKSPKKTPKPKAKKASSPKKAKKATKK